MLLVAAVFATTCGVRIDAVYLPVLQCAALYFCHACRADNSFIRLFFGRKRFLVYWLEYALLSLPLLVLSACKTHRLGILLQISVILLSPFLFGFKAKPLHLDHPFLMTGSYEHWTAFRRNYGALFCCYLAAGMGLYHANANLFRVFCRLAGLLYINPMVREEPPLYTANFSGVKDLCTLKFKQICCNVTVLCLPLLLISAAMDGCLLWEAVFMTLLMIMLAHGSLLLKYATGNSFLAGCAVVCALFPLFVLSLRYPYAALLFPLLMLFLHYKNIPAIKLFIPL
jgi:hypothetical protein